MEEFGWYKNPLTMFFSDGSILMPQSDDEGNDGGAMWFQDGKTKKDHIVYVI